MEDFRNAFKFAEQNLVSEQSFKTLPVGEYIGEIKEITPEVSESKAGVRTPRYVFRVENTDPNNPGFISIYCSVIGYKKIAGTKLNEIDPETGQPMQDEEATKRAINVIKDLAFHAGVPKSEKFKVADMLNQKIGIVVALNDYNQKPYVASWESAESMAEVLSA